MSEVLSGRERQIAEAYASGESYRAIAERFRISPATVRTHLSTIYRKLGVSSKLELYRVLMLTAPEDAQDCDYRALVSELALNLDHALRRERAVAEVLRIISRTHGDVRQVIAAVLEYALELCDAESGILFEYCPRAGFRAIFYKGIPSGFRDWLEARGTFHADAMTGLGRVEARRQTVSIPDVRSEFAYRRGDPLRLATADLGGARSFAAIPMIAGERLIGAFTIYRETVRPFDEKALEVAKIFADQSVIAIENARLVRGHEAIPNERSRAGARGRPWPARQ